MTPINNILMDMDGVLVRGRTPIPGAPAFIDQLNANGIEYLVLTNNPLYTPSDLAHRLQTKWSGHPHRAHLHFGDGHGPISPLATTAGQGIRHR